MAKSKITKEQISHDVKNYNRNTQFEYFTYLERIDLDQERMKDIKNGTGFIVTSPKGIANNLKEPDGVFSPRFGQTLQDLNPYADRYKCECGELMGRIYLDIECPKCKEKVRFIDDDLSYFGWIVLKKEYPVIHPNLYKSIEYFIGSKRLNNIIKPLEEKDEHGKTIEVEKPPNEPYMGLDIMGFRENFDEVMEYYLEKYPHKVEYFNDIMANRSKVFCHSIPVYSTLLRPFKEESKFLFYNDTNEIYVLMARLAHVINTDDLKIFRKRKPKAQLLYDLQMEMNKLYDEMIEILSKKKGEVRSLFGGRCNFTARNVIIPDPKLRVDEIKLSYFSLVELLQQRIINILHKSHNMSYDEAYKIWYKSSINPDPNIVSIIQGIIDNYDRGIPILINRNPTISYGSILQMYVVGIEPGYTMSIPLQITATMGAEIGS